VNQPPDLRSKQLRRNVVLLSFSHPPARLTHAERAIALGIVAGWSNAKIAQTRGVSMRTIANQVAALLKKLGVTSRTELAARFSATDLLGE